MLRQSPSSIATLAILCALTTVSESTLIYRQQAAFAQSPAPLTLPSAVPEGTTVRIDGSDSMAAINQTLKQQFEAQFPKTNVEVADQGTEAALKALQEDRIDLVAIGRGLTPEEQAAGLVQVPVTRRKVAVVVSDKNPFPGDMTGEQFSQIFRGEITNWSQVGGPDKPIRVIDRLTSDTRPTLQPYPVFQSAPFQTGTTAVPIDKESTDAMIRELGDDGISYAVIDQVINKPGVRLVSLYGTLPTDPSYPFSQALTYVYKGPTPNPSVQAFLGYVTAPDSQKSLAAAAPSAVGAAAGIAAGAGSLAQSAANSVPPITGAGSPPPNDAANPGAAGSPPPSGASNPSPAPDATLPDAQVQPISPDTVAQAPDLGVGRSGIPSWLWLLAIPVLAALIWVLLKGPDRSSATGSAPVSVAGLAADRNGENSRIVLVPRSSHEAYAYWEVPESHKQRIRKEEGGENLALRLYDVTGLDFEQHPAHSIEQFDCDESVQDLHIPIPQSDRDYLVELGYVTYQGRWCKLARSAPVHVPAEGEPQIKMEASAPELPAPIPVIPSAPPTSFPRWEDSFKTGGIPLTDPMSAAGPPNLTLDRTLDRTTETPEVRETSIRPEVDDTLTMGAALTAGTAVGLGAAASAAAGTAAGIGQRSRVRRSRIVLVPRNSQNAYAYWEVLDHHKEIAKQHGGETFILRICDVTGVDLDHAAPHSIQQFNCEETDFDRHVTVPDLGEYVAEIGYLASNGRWLRIARSTPVSIPPSDVRTLED